MPCCTPKRRTILHVDVNSAFLSWEAADRLKKGDPVDIRELACVVGGNPKTRRGIVLAKSSRAKKAGVQTGESLYHAFKKCPNLTVVSPNYDLYLNCSQALVDLLKSYSPLVEKISIDECFVELSPQSNAMGVAKNILKEIEETLGFSVSIGVSSNKLLAKVASDFKAPTAISTLYPEEMETKFWPLPIGHLYMVGRVTKKKLERLGIFTIGDLAHSHMDMLQNHFGKYGKLIWEYANGIENALVNSEEHQELKGIGHSTTTPQDLTTREEAALYLLSLSEMVGARLRHTDKECNLISVSLKSSDFETYSHQRKLQNSTCSTETIYRESLALFESVWKNEPLRHIGIRVTSLTEPSHEQLSFFSTPDSGKSKKLDQTIDQLRTRFGSDSIVRGSLLHANLTHMKHGIEE